MIYFSATIRAMQAHIETLHAQIIALEAERAALLDRLLEKRNIAPIAEHEKAERGPAVQVIAPFGVPREAEEAIRASWLQEETEYLQVSAGYDYERARAVAEANWLRQNKAVL